MPLGQSFLNAWVKVNSKHIVIPPTNKNEKDELNHGRGGKGSVTTARTVTTSEDTETQVIRRFDNRKNKRRLHKTVSASDLLRDKSKGEKKEDKQVIGEPATETQFLNVHRNEEQSVVSENEGSLRFVAGFFGADLESIEGSRHSQFQTNLDDAASIQLIGPYTQLDAGSVQSRGGQSLPARTSQRNSPPHGVNDSSSSKGGKIGIRFPPNLFAGDSSSKGGCKHCSKLENKLASAREDLEYLRGAALRNEYSCFNCKQETQNSSNDEDKSSEATPTSDTLNEIISRHKIYVDNLKKDSSSRQQEMYVKFQKYSTLCKDLNEEAEFRNEEALNLHNELNAVRSQRDQMTTEIEKLRARISQYERNDQERRKSELLLQQYEQKGLDGVEKAIQCRDGIIQDLAARLERALDCLRQEREQQRQRRQIIFPTQRPTHYVQGRSGVEVEAELKSTKESLLACQDTVESLRRENKRRELEWMVRLEELERQLEAAR